MQVRLSSRSLSGVLAACLLSPLVSVVPATTAIASPVFDDEHLTHTFLHGLAALASSDAILTGARAEEEVDARLGRGVSLPLASTPCHLGETKPLYDAVVPAVVAVSSVYKCERCSDWHLGGSGSGWIVSPDGLVVTNHHVIQREAGHRMGIMMADGEVYAITEVVAADPVGDAVVVRIDPRYFRPAEVETLLGDPTKAREMLGWTPTTTLEELVAEMVAADREEAAKEALLRRKGFQVVGSMENPPTNPRAVEQARGGVA
jgi:hypothetical protein